MSHDLERRLPLELVIEDTLFHELRQHNYSKIILHSLLNISAFILAGLLSLQAHVLWLHLVFWLVQAYLLDCFFDIAHECVHNNYGNSSRINRIAGVLWFLPLLVNFSLVKCQHLEHHKYTRVAGDPELPGEPSNFWEYVSGYLLIFSSSLTRMSVEAAFGKIPSFMRSEKVRRDIQADTFALVFWLVLMCICTLFFWRYTVLMYWMPLLFVYLISHIIEMLGHYGCDQGSCLLSNTRTISSDSFNRFLRWNGNYHAEHHAYPSVPGHSLHRLHTLIGRHFKYQERSYILCHLKLIRSLLEKQNASTSDDSIG